MSRARLAEALGPLPFALREQVEGYVSFVEETAAEAFTGANIRPDDELLDEFSYFAGLRRLWTLVDTEFWLIDRSLVLGRDFGLDGITAGGSRFSRGQGQHLELGRLRDNLLNEFSRLEILDLVQSNSLEELASVLWERRNRGSR